MKNNFLGILMIIIEDSEYFDEDTLPLIFSEGALQHYYKRRRGLFREIWLNVGIIQRGLLHCSTLNEVHLLPGAHYRRCGADFLSVEFIKSGTLQFRQEGRAYELKQREMFLFQPKLMGEFFAVNSECVKRSFTINGKLLSAFLESSDLGSCEVFDNVDFGKINMFWDSFESLGRESGEDAEQKNSILTYQFLEFLCNPKAQESISHEFHNLTDFIDSNLSEVLTVTDMAAFCKLSVSHFIREFKRFHQITPYQLLIERRMHRAAHMLLSDKTLYVKEISEQAGYSTPFHFSMEFKKYFGMSPRSYRKRHFSPM